MARRKRKRKPREDMVFGGIGFVGRERGLGEKGRMEKFRVWVIFKNEYFGLELVWRMVGLFFFR
jgi:hypothetical protein